MQASTKPFLFFEVFIAQRPSAGAWRSICLRCQKVLCPSCLKIRVCAFLREGISFISWYRSQTNPGMWSPQNFVIPRNLLTYLNISRWGKEEIGFILYLPNPLSSHMANTKYLADLWHKWNFFMDPLWPLLDRKLRSALVASWKSSSIGAHIMRLYISGVILVWWHPREFQVACYLKPKWWLFLYSSILWVAIPICFCRFHYMHYSVHLDSPAPVI